MLDCKVISYYNSECHQWTTNLCFHIHTILVVTSSNKFSWLFSLQLAWNSTDERIFQSERCKIAVFLFIPLPISSLKQNDFTNRAAWSIYKLLKLKNNSFVWSLLLCNKFVIEKVCWSNRNDQSDEIYFVECRCFYKDCRKCSLWLKTITDSISYKQWYILKLVPDPCKLCCWGGVRWKGCLKI